MSNDKLILRILNSPYIDDITRSKILAWEDVDGNFLHLKGLEILTGSTAGSSTLVLTKYNGDSIEVELSGMTSAFTEYYTNEEPTPTTIGGIEAGSTFTGKTMQEMWDALLYPYQYPAFTSFSLNGWTSSRYEVGTEISVSQTFNWGTSNPSNIVTNSISIAGYNLTTLTGLANDGSEAVTFTGIVTRSDAGTRTWTITGQNTKGGSFSRNASVRWDWRQYWGQSSNGSLTESEIEGLASNRLAPSGVLGNYSFPASGYKYFCFPDGEYTAPSDFKDTDTGFGVAMYGGYPYSQNGYNYDKVSVTNANGITIDYRVYRTQNVLGGAVNFTIS